MSYTLVDLLEKLIVIEQNACSIYENIASSEDSGNLQLNSAAKVLAREEQRHVEFYTRIKNEISVYEDIDIGFDIYDKAASLIQEFKRYMIKPNVHGTQELLKYALDLEKENIALLLNIQGRLVRNVQDAVSTNYMALSDLITEEKKHIENLEFFASK